MGSSLRSKRFRPGGVGEPNGVFDVLPARKMGLNQKKTEWFSSIFHAGKTPILPFLTETLATQARWAPTWRLHTNLYKFGGKASPHILLKKSCCDLNLGESLCIVTFFLFSGSRVIESIERF